MLLRVVASALGLAGAARAQMFGDLPAAPPHDRCPYGEFQGRTQVVQDACCPNPEDCAAGMPAACDIACGAVFVRLFFRSAALPLTHGPGRARSPTSSTTARP